eukprot:712857-Amphidinium_carterae.2
MKFVYQLANSKRNTILVYSEVYSIGDLERFSWYRAHRIAWGQVCFALFSTGDGRLLSCNSVKYDG